MPTNMNIADIKRAVASKVDQSFNMDQISDAFSVMIDVASKQQKEIQKQKAEIQNQKVEMDKQVMEIENLNLKTQKNTLLELKLDKLAHHVVQMDKKVTKSSGQCS